MRFWLSVFISLMFFPLAANASGYWNDFERQHAVFKVLKSKSNRLDCKKSCKHEIFNVLSLKFNDHEKKLIAAISADPNHNCHACAPQISYFLYRVDSEGWELTSSHLAFHTFGSWGHYPQELMSFQKVSESAGVIILGFSYTGQGYTERSTTVLLSSGESLKAVLATCSGSSNEGAIYDPETQTLEDWTGKIKEPKNSFGEKLSDLIFDINDIANNSRSTARFEFDGKRYRYISGDERMSNCEYS